MLSQKIEIFQVIEDWIISKKTTLKEDIINAIRKNSPLTDNEIINIVVKYFVSYLYPDKINQQISEIDINYLYSLTNFFFKISKNSWIVIENLTKEEISLLDFIQKNWYSLSMLWDIAATVELFKEIVNKEISPIWFNYEYLWLDLWTWSWILLLAQYIQANRNWFECISNYWIEISLSSFRTKNLVDCLLFWEIRSWNTTREETYNFLKYSDWQLTHVSNETIPTVWISFWHYLVNKAPHNPDPFIENNKALFSACKWNITDATRFFPEKIRVVLSGNPKDVIDNSNKMIIEKWNEFWISIFKDLEDKIKKEKWNDVFSINPFIFPTWIEIWWKINRQDDIWKRLIESWKIKQLPDWRKRWNNINY